MDRAGLGFIIIIFLYNKNKIYNKNKRLGDISPSLAVMRKAPTLPKGRGPLLPGTHRPSFYFFYYK
jgi:hypothetical protein